MQWIEHKCAKILLLNGKGLSEADNFAALEDLQQALLKEPTAALVLIDLSKTTMAQKTASKSKEVAAATKAAGVPFGPNAIVGLTNLQKSVAELSMKQVYYADSVEEAKEWPVREVERPQKG